jgi:CBS domain-containing protein
MIAADMMTSKVMTISPDASVRDVASMLLTHRISAVPVVDTRGQLVGIVSEGDLLRRAEAGTERHRSWWNAFNSAKDVLAAEFVKSHGRKVADIMTRKVLTVRADTPASDIAKLMEENAIKRVPVVEQGKVVGVVSRADFLTALAGLWQRPAQAVEDGTDLRAHILAQLETMPWVRPAIINVAVHDRVVELSGIVESEAQKCAVRVAAEATPGVSAVEDNVRVQRIATSY